MKENISLCLTNRDLFISSNIWVLNDSKISWILLGLSFGYGFSAFFIAKINTLIYFSNENSYIGLKFLS